MSERRGAESTRRGRGAWAFVPGAGVSIFFTVLFLAGLHWQELTQALALLDPSVAVLAALILSMEFPLRALRWRILLLPLERAAAAGGRVRPLLLPSLLSITLAGALANLVLPARLGEFVKPLLASRMGGLPFQSLLVITVLERVFDLMGLVFILSLTALTLPMVGGVHLDSGEMAWLSTATQLLALGSVVGIVALFSLASGGPRMRPLVVRLAGLLPEPLAGFGLRLFDGVLAGLSVFHGVRVPLMAGMVSLVIWINGTLAIWCLMAAFALALPFTAASFLQVTMALAVAPPQLPGFIGLFQYAAQRTLQVWDVNTAVAQAWALAFWGVSFGPVIVGGWGALWAMRLSFTGLWRELLALRQPQAAGADPGTPPSPSAEPPVVAPTSD